MSVMSQGSALPRRRLKRIYQILEERKCRIAVDPMRGSYNPCLKKLSGESSCTLRFTPQSS
jgi:hypothetical protein